ncbi:MAG: zinc-dependent metalloprotease [Fimbriiglobus sp.]|jgi:hypothetical protein|nr:zinc-dependent metalloprotease [Fimbriiglobus sp.]
MFLRSARGLMLAAGLVALIAASVSHSQPATPAAPEPPKFPDFAVVTKGAKVQEGLFTLYQKDETLLAEIQPTQFDKPFLMPIAVAKGGGVGGTTLNFDQQWVISFRRVGDKVFVVRKNVKYTARPGTPEAKALDTTYTDSVLAALPVKSINPMKGAVLIDLNQIFFTDFADLGAGFIDRDRTTWYKVKAFKKNVELQVAATVVGANTRRVAPSGGDAVIDRRGATVVIHYGLVELPDPGYQPRKADDRVGHFTTVQKDFSKDGPDSAFVRYVNRWRLERADGSPWKEGGKLVPPKKKIVFWIENSVPDEYRTAVREGILEWNKAFEKIGFRDAVEVRQQEGEEFDPEDVTYATFRWITSEVPYAIGPSRANPYTGEILDADILFDASMVRTYKGESRLFRDPTGKPFDPASPAQANRRGWTLPSAPLDRLRENLGWNDRAEKFDPDQHRQRQLAAVQHGYCQCAAQKTSELGLAVLSLAAAGGLTLKEGEKIPEELLLQAIKETVMHEVGHTLGLRHNFKASTVLKAEQLHDTAITSKQGLVGSVMDYNPANIAPKGTKQGHYFTPTLGAYDYWAIEYAYTPNGSDADLAKVASRCADPKLIYATDEDLMGTNDPLVNQWDMGADPLQYAKDRAKLAADLIPAVAEKMVDKGEGYQRARAAFATLFRVYGDSAFTATRFIGGTAFHRDHKDDPNAREAFVPVPPAKQREALAFLKESILTDKPFDFPPELLRKLGADRWVHWGNEGAMQATEFPVISRALGIHQTVLDELLAGGTLTNVQNSARLLKADDKPLQVAEIFRALSDACFADLPSADGKASAVKSSVVRRNLQREYVARLAGMVVGRPTGSGLFLLFGGGGSAPPDAKSLARLHLKEAIKRVDLATAVEKDDTAKAHFDEMKEQIEKVLKATVTSDGP